MMRPPSRLCALFLGALALFGSAPIPAAMAYYCEDGQQPVPPEVAARMALPLCGFAAAKRWGPNGCQLCDSRNIHPNPFTGYENPYRTHRYRAYQ
jgi:hypothetical protein